MFDFIKGQKTYLDPLTLVVETPYYGFRVLTTQDSYATFEPQDEVRVFLYTQMINDSIFLYGFASELERTFFKALTSVSGIGPRLAIRALSHTSYKEIYHAIISDNAKAITQLPGIGAKTAQKIILELKDKVQNMPVDKQANLGSSEVFSEAFMALENFGFEAAKIKAAIKILQSKEQNWELQSLIKELLALVNKK